MIKTVKRFRHGVLVEFNIDGVSQPLGGGTERPQITRTKTEHTPVRSPITDQRSISPNPGDLFSIVILKVTGQQTTKCGECGRRKKRMNQWGWVGCWRNRKTIAAWISQEARKRGHAINESSALDLIKAALKELRSRQKDQTIPPPNNSPQLSDPP